MARYIFILFVMLNFLSCKTSDDLPTVARVDIEKYTGLWYEIARLPNSFEKGLDCTTARYKVLENGKIEVTNKGYIIESEGATKTAIGTAHIPNLAFPGRLKVTFYWPFYGKYYIMSLDNDYKYALVGDPSRKYLWVLARTPELDDTIYNTLLETAQKQGFAVENMIKVNQDCHQ